MAQALKSLRLPERFWQSIFKGPVNVWGLGGGRVGDQMSTVLIG